MAKQYPLNIKYYYTISHVEAQRISFNVLENNIEQIIKCKALFTIIVFFFCAQQLKKERI